MIRECTESDIGIIFEIINDAAQKYKGVIPEDRWHEPYMPFEELRHEIEDGVIFWGEDRNGRLLGVMGFQDKGDVTLIRHAYVLPAYQRQGIGSRLLSHLKTITTTPYLLVGTWAAAYWAVGFYQGHGFRLLADKDGLLAKYWDIPQRQIETSVVLGTEVDHA